MSPKRLLIALLIAATPCAAQNIARRQTVSTPGRYQVQNLTGLGIMTHNLSWSVTGTVSACTIKLQQSIANPQVWSDLSPTYTCTSSGYGQIINASTVYIAVQLVTFTGSGSISFTYQGFQADPQALQIAVGTNLSVSGVPGGPCYQSQMATNTLTGDQYNCKVIPPATIGTWNLITGGGGSSIFTSYQFGGNTAITGIGNYLQLTFPGIFTATQTGAGSSGSPYVDAVDTATQTANTVWAGPTSGGAAQPTFRHIVLPDLPAIGNNTILSNISGGSAVSGANSITAILDSTLGTTQGSIIYRGAGAWTLLGPGTNGQFLQTQGASANPLWGTISVSGCTPGGSSGDLQKNNGAGGCNASTLNQASDTSVNASKALTEAAPSAPAFSAAGTTTCDLSLSNVCAPGSITGNTTLAVSNPHGSGPYTVRWTQDGTGHASPITYPAAFQNFCQPSATATVVTEITFHYDSTTNYYMDSCTTTDTPTIFSGPTRSAPATPASGDACWLDSTDLRLECKDNSGVIYKQGKFPSSSVAHQPTAYSDTTGAAFEQNAVTFSALTDGATVAWDMLNAFQISRSLTFTTHGGTRTLNVTNVLNGTHALLVLTQDGTGGETLTLGTGCIWLVIGGDGSGHLPLSSGAGAKDLFSFSYDGTTCYGILSKAAVAP